MEHSLKPYIELMRLDKPTGIYLLAWPCLWSIAFADPGRDYLWLYFVFAVGAIIMRSAECVINDIVDRKIDAKVSRTKHRPLASGKIRVRSALLLLAGLFVVGLFLLVTLSYTAIILGLCALVPMAIYPFTKRFTYWPQAFLGITINWGALMGWAAVKDSIGIPAILLYFAAIFWTIGYDTIYGHQDKIDDLELGVKSTALKFGEKTKSYLFIFYGLTILLLWFVGAMLKVNFWYHIFLLFGLLHFIWQILYLDIHNPDNCLRVFKANAWFGGIIFIGIFLGNV